MAPMDDGAGLAPALIVLPGAKLMAEGTLDAPITFTSTETDLLPVAGLWGGLIVMGNAPVHNGQREVEGITGYTYGGADASESSGSLKFVRVWYGGEVIGANNEINGITLAGVGSGTTVENCEVAFNLDDGFEMFGGTVNLKWVSALFCGDDALDTDQGYQGKIQYAYVMIGAGGNHGVEMDSKIDDTPRSFPQLYSATFIHHLDGEPNSVSSDDQFDATLRLREGTGGEFGNIIVTNVPNTGVFQNDCGSEIRTHELPSTGGVDYLWFSSQNIIYGAVGISLFDLDNCTGLDTALEVDPMLAFMPSEAEVDSIGFDPRPLEGSPAFNNVDEVPSDGFFDPVSYKGAFEANLWLDGMSWLSDNMKLVTMAVSGNITEDTTWASGVRLTGQTFVQPGVTLTIMPGVNIVSEKDDGNGLAPVLVILPGATIMAEGMADAPITFTSAEPASSLPAPGLWGGLIVMGNAPVHNGQREVEGIVGYTYGGADASESSGSLKYVRVWYGGEVIGANNEINGITLAGVGSGTTVENCEVAFNLDDGFEMFGGSVNLKWISALFCGDDAIDTDQGYVGKIQYAYVMIGAGGNHGVEMDSKIDDTPRSFPQLYSATFVPVPKSNTNMPC